MQLNWPLSTSGGTLGNTTAEGSCEAICMACQQLVPPYGGSLLLFLLSSVNFSPFVKVLNVLVASQAPVT